MGVATICDIVQEVMENLWTVLCPTHMPIPTEQSFFDIAQDFFLRWDLPHCIGAIDGKHVAIKKPSNSGSKYYNYKHFYSIVLQAVVDAKLKFIDINVGGYGHQHDATTLRNSSFYAGWKQNRIQIPEDDELPYTQTMAPYFFIADGAYPIEKHLMKPYPGKNLSQDQKNYNKRLSKARATVECSFGRLCQKWRIFSTTIQQRPEKAELIVKAACILHNVIIDKEGHSIDAAARCQDDETVVDEAPPALEENEREDVTREGQRVRNILTQYLMEH